MSFRKTVLLLLVLAFFALGTARLGSAVTSYQAARSLAEFAAQVGSSVPCDRPPLTAPDAWQAMVTILPDLSSPILQAAAYCAHGERAAAYNLYAQAASTGDFWAAMQVFFLSHGQEISAGLPAELSPQELNAAQYISLQTVPDTDWRLLIRQVLVRNPADEIVWQVWLAEGGRLEQQKQWAAALAWYQEGLDKQRALGFAAFRSSLAMRAGSILQNRVELRDLRQALAFYNEALQAQRFLGEWERIGLYISRGQVLYELRSEVGPGPALAEFQQALAMDGHNFSATLWMGIVYYYGFTDLQLALNWFQRAAPLGDANPYVHYYLGLTYAKLGQSDSAAQEFDRALQINPDWSEVRQLREALP